MKAVTLEEARHRWNGALAPRIPSIEYVSPQQAYGRIVGQDIRAIHPYPPYRKSPFDGYALHLDTQCRTYEIIATIGAGMLYTSPVAPGQAVRLMTGCAVPDSCNTVIMQEQTIRTGHTLEITVPLQAGDNIVPAGEECRRGDLLLPHGTYLTSGDVSVAVGIRRFRCIRISGYCFSHPGGRLSCPAKSGMPGRFIIPMHFSFDSF